MFGVNAEPVNIHIDHGRKPVPCQNIPVSSDSTDRRCCPQIIYKCHRADISAMQDQVRCSTPKCGHQIFGQMTTSAIYMRIGDQQDGKQIFCECQINFHKNIIITYSLTII